eukprot:6178761-Pleurochrysis_carterae.AAC.1
MPEVLDRPDEREEIGKNIHPAATRVGSSMPPSFSLCRALAEQPSAHVANDTFFRTFRLAASSLALYPHASISFLAHARPFS